MINKENIVNWMDENGFEYQIRGDELLTKNPFAHNDKFKFSIRLEERNDKDKTIPVGMCHDWRPQYSDCNVNFVKFVMRYKNLSYKDAVNEVGGDIKHSNRKNTKPREILNLKFNIQWPDCSLPLTNDKYKKLHEMTVNYVKSRCITEEDIILYNIHYNTEGLIFPYYEYEEFCYWQMRSIIGKSFTFPSNEVFNVSKGDFFFGFDLVKYNDDLIITESIIDSISIGPGSVASGGASLTDNQVNKISLFNPKRIILAPDNDDAGIASILKNYELLHKYDIWYCIPVGDGFKDWNDFDKKTKLHHGIHKYIISNCVKLGFKEKIKLKKKLIKNKKDIDVIIN